MVYDYFSGNIKKACEAQLNAMELIDALFYEVNPIPVKYAMSYIGFPCGKPRLPLVELSEKGKDRLLQCINQFIIS